MEQPTSLRHIASKFSSSFRCAEISVARRINTRQTSIPPKGGCDVRPMQAIQARVPRYANHRNLGITLMRIAPCEDFLYHLKPPAYGLTASGRREPSGSTPGSSVSNARGNLPQELLESDHYLIHVYIEPGCLYFRGQTELPCIFRT